MSDLSGLDELFDYKNQVMEDLLSEPKIVSLIDDENRYAGHPEKLMYTQVFPYEYTPSVTEHATTYVCCEVDIKEITGKTFLVPVLYIWAFTHNEKTRLPEGGVRVDKLCSEIAKKMNGSRYYGLGQMSLESLKRFSPITNYQGRVLMFQTKDFNRIHADDVRMHPIPDNRKRVLGD